MKYRREVGPHKNGKNHFGSARTGWSVENGHLGSVNLGEGSAAGAGGAAKLGQGLRRRGEDSLLRARDPLQLSSDEHLSFSPTVARQHRKRRHSLTSALFKDILCRYLKKVQLWCIIL